MFEAKIKKFGWVPCFAAPDGFYFFLPIGSERRQKNKNPPDGQRPPTAGHGSGLALPVWEAHSGPLWLDVGAEGSALPLGRSGLFWAVLAGFRGWTGGRLRGSGCCVSGLVDTSGRQRPPSGAQRAVAALRVCLASVPRQEGTAGRLRRFLGNTGGRQPPPAPLAR